MRAAIVFFAVLVASLAVAAAPQTGATLSSSETPVSAGTKPFVATYGLCSGPQNADAFPSSPVPVVETQCDFTQEFHATAVKVEPDASCGGFTITFGPKGDLKRKWKYLWLTGKWGDTPPTQATCSTSYIAAAAWGYLCANAECTSGAWERIGTAKKVQGTWNSTSQVCYLSVGANTGSKDYSTVTMDVIATQGTGTAKVYKRAAGSIHNQRPNGKCFSTTYTPQRRSPAAAKPQ
jgi:hypothetical protein